MLLGGGSQEVIARRNIMKDETNDLCFLQLSLMFHLFLLQVIQSLDIQYCFCTCMLVLIWCVCICVCIDPRLGWEPCSVPAWLINGVVMAIGRNEGTKRRRPASPEPYAPPGTRTDSHTNTNLLSML